MHSSFNIKHFAVQTSRSEKIFGPFLGGKDLYRHSSLSLFCLSYYANMVSLGLLMPCHLVSDTMNIFLGFYSTLFCPVSVCMCRFFALVLRGGIIALLSISVKGQVFSCGCALPCKIYQFEHISSNLIFLQGNILEVMLCCKPSKTLVFVLVYED